MACSWQMRTYGSVCNDVGSSESHTWPAARLIRWYRVATPLMLERSRSAKLTVREAVAKPGDTTVAAEPRGLRNTANTEQGMTNLFTGRRMTLIPRGCRDIP